MKHKKRKHKHHTKEPFNAAEFMHQVEMEMERDGMFSKFVPDHVVTDLIEIGTAAFTFIRLSNIDSRTKKAFAHLEKQFNVTSDLIQLR